MKNLAIASIIGAVISFSAWPVLAGTHIRDCGQNADCAGVREYSSRLAYIVDSQHFKKKWQDEGFDSRNQFCSYAQCISETVTVPISIVVGAGLGVVLAKLLSRQIHKTKKT